MKQMMEQHFILNEQEPWFESLWQMFEPTGHQLQVSIDYDVGGWIYIKYCPRCGTKLHRDLDNELQPKGTPD